MNISLLKLGTRYRDGSYQWTVPGYNNRVTYVPSKMSFNGFGPTLHWPAMDKKGELRTGADLNRHRPLAKKAIRQLIIECSK